MAIKTLPTSSTPQVELCSNEYSKSTSSYSLEDIATYLSRMYYIVMLVSLYSKLQA